jgi:hypothetical protein
MYEVFFVVWANFDEKKYEIVQHLHVTGTFYTLFESLIRSPALHGHALDFPTLVGYGRGSPGAHHKATSWANCITDVKKYVS